MSNIYYWPEEYGLEIIGEVDDPDACYDFDLIVVWKRKDDGALFYGTDSGCSCPEPFEDFHGVGDLTQITDATFDAFKKDLADHCHVSTPGAFNYREVDPAADAKANLIRKVHMGLREVSAA
jgi:hypothetical protein